MSSNSQGTNSNHKNFDDSESVITTSSMSTRKIENLSLMAMIKSDKSNYKTCVHLIKPGQYLLRRRTQLLERCEQLLNSCEQLLNSCEQILESREQLLKSREQLLEKREAIQESMERNVVNQNAARLFEEVIDVEEEQRQPKQSENCFFGMLSGMTSALIHFLMNSFGRTRPHHGNGYILIETNSAAGESTITPDDNKMDGNH